MNTFWRVSEATPAGDINESPVPPAANILSTKLHAKKIFRLYSNIWYCEIFQKKGNIFASFSNSASFLWKKTTIFLHSMLTFVWSLDHEGNLFGYPVFAVERAIYKFAEWILSQKLSWGWVFVSVKVCALRQLTLEVALNNNKFARYSRLIIWRTIITKYDVRKMPRVNLLNQ